MLRCEPLNQLVYCVRYEVWEAIIRGDQLQDPVIVGRVEGGGGVPIFRPLRYVPLFSAPPKGYGSTGSNYLPKVGRAVDRCPLGRSRGGGNCLGFWSGTESTTITMQNLGTFVLEELGPFGRYVPLGRWMDT